MLIVGDSLNHQFYEVLHMQLETPRDPYGQWDNIHNFPGYGAVCLNKGGGKLVYIRNDQIKVGGTDPYKTVRYRPDNRNWFSVIHNFDIIIINKGPHFVENVNEFIMDTNKTAEVLFKLLFLLIFKFKIFVINVLNLLYIYIFIFFQALHIFASNSQKKIQIIFRTSALGHPFSTKYTLPITTIIDPSFIFPNYTSLNWGNKTSEKFKKYYATWDKFKERDDIAIEILANKLGSNLTVLHIKEMTFNRPDRHIRCNEFECDALHYLIPSVIDHWCHVLYNLMN